VLKEGHIKPAPTLRDILVSIPFLQESGLKALITSPRGLAAAVQGKVGTHIVR
jgi:carbamate kinase